MLEISKLGDNPPDWLKDRFTTLNPSKLPDHDKLIVNSDSAINKNSSRAVKYVKKVVNIFKK